MSSELPEGWSLLPLSELATETRDRWKPDHERADEVEHFSIPAFDTGRRPVIESETGIKSAKFLVQDGDTLLSRLNPVTPRVWLVQKFDPAFDSVASSEMLVLRPTAVHPAFLSYALVGPGPVQTMVERASGTTGSRQRVARKDALSMPVPTPPLDEQRAIAEVLGSLDDRIAHLDDRTERLWDTLDLVARPNGGGQDTTVGDVVTFHNRKRVPLSRIERDDRLGPYPYHGATGVFGYVDDYLFDGDYVLVAEDGASVVDDDGRPRVQFVHGQFWVNNHAHVLTSDVLTPGELAAVLRRASVRGYVTGAAQPKLSMGRLKQVPLTIPAMTGVRRDATTSATSEVKRAAIERETLQSTRDALLPELVTGRLRINDVKGFLERAGLS